MEKLFTDALVDTKEFNDEEQSFVGWASRPVIDRDNEVIAWNAWDLKNWEKNKILLWAHDYKALPLGTCLWGRKTRQGLKIKPSLSKVTEDGKAVYLLYKEGTLKTFSVGFKPQKWIVPEDDEKGIWSEWIPVGKEDAKLVGYHFENEKGWIEDKCISWYKNYGEALEDFTPVIFDLKSLVKLNEDDKPSRVYTKAELLEVSCVPVPSCPDALVEAAETGRIKAKGLVGYFVEKGIVQEEAPVPEAIPEVDSTEEQPCEHEWDAAMGEFCVKCGAINPDANLHVTKDEYIRWNKALPIVFDGALKEDSLPTKPKYQIYRKFLKCDVKDIYQNSFFIWSPEIGNYLTAMKVIMGGFDPVDIRDFDSDGVESPPRWEVIQVTSKVSDDFLVKGTVFYHAEDRKLIVRVSPAWSGLDVDFLTSKDDREWNKELFDRIFEYADSHHCLKNEKFALNGEFLPDTDISWDELVISDPAKKAIQTSVKMISDKQKGMKSRGLLFTGPPGTGKTLTGRIIANQVKATFIWVSSKDFAEIHPVRALSLGFELANKLAPSVLFMEDIDTWIGGYTTDLLKTEMDGIRQNKGIMTILTSNFPEQLPDALLDRPGRFHHIVDFPLPDDSLRLKMLASWGLDVPEDSKSIIIEATEGFSGAHVRELFDYAQVLAEEDGISLEEAVLKSLGRLLEQRELIERIREGTKSSDGLSLSACFKSIETGDVDAQEKGATPHADLPLMAENAAWNPGGVADSRIIEAILGRDPAAGDWTAQMNANARKVNCWWDGKGGKIAAFKLKIGRRDPITDKSAPLKYNWHQTANRMAVLMGARAGVDIPPGDRKPVYNRLVFVYKKFDKEPPEFKEYTDEELKYIDWSLEAEAGDTYQWTDKFGADEAQEIDRTWADTVAAYRSGDTDEDMKAFNEGEEFNPMKPYPNEHACRINPPGKYDRLRRNNCFRKSDSKCIDYIFGVADGKSEVQAMRYKKADGWEAAAARAHCKSHDGTFEAAARTLEEIEAELDSVETEDGKVYGEWEGEGNYIELSDEDVDELARSVLEQEDDEYVELTDEDIDELAKRKLNQEEEEKRQAEVTKLADEIAELRAEIIVLHGGSA